MLTCDLALYHSPAPLRILLALLTCPARCELSGVALRFLMRHWQYIIRERRAAAAASSPSSDEAKLKGPLGLLMAYVAAHRWGA